jgi:hypothetical protein
LLFNLVFVASNVSFDFEDTICNLSGSRACACETLVMNFQFVVYGSFEC